MLQYFLYWIFVRIYEFIHVKDSEMLNKLIFSFLPVSSSFILYMYIEYLLGVSQYLAVNKKQKTKQKKPLCTQEAY